MRLVSKSLPIFAGGHISVTVNLFHGYSQQYARLKLLLAIQRITVEHAENLSRNLLHLSKCDTVGSSVSENLSHNLLYLSKWDTVGLSVRSWLNVLFGKSNLTVMPDETLWKCDTVEPSVRSWLNVLFGKSNLTVMHDETLWKCCLEEEVFVKSNLTLLRLFNNLHMRIRFHYLFFISFYLNDLFGT